MASMNAALARGPPGAVPFNNAITTRQIAGNRDNRRRSDDLRAIMMPTPSAAMVASQPSIEIGLSPQPNRRGANHNFLPTNGVVRTRSLWHRRSWLPLGEMSTLLCSGGGVPARRVGVRSSSPPIRLASSDFVEHWWLRISGRRDPNGDIADRGRRKM